MGVYLHPSPTDGPHQAFHSWSLVPCVLCNGACIFFRVGCWHQINVVIYMRWPDVMEEKYELFCVIHLVVRRNLFWNLSFRNLLSCRIISFFYSWYLYISSIHILHFIFVASLPMLWSNFMCRTFIRSNGMLPHPHTQTHVCMQESRGHLYLQIFFSSLSFSGLATVWYSLKCSCMCGLL